MNKNVCIGQKIGKNKRKSMEKSDICVGRRKEIESGKEE
jgi:hypothetical protein